MNGADSRRVLVRPKPALARAGLLGTVLVTLTLFGSLYLVTIPDGPWGLVVVAQVLASAVAAFWFARYFTATVEVTEHQVIMRMFPHRPRRYPLADIARILLAEVYVGSTTDSHAQLSALTDAGTLLFRMRGKFWDHADLLAVASATEAPLVDVGRPVTAKELAAEFTRR